MTQKKLRGWKSPWKGQPWKQWWSTMLFLLQPKTLDTSVKHLKLGGEEKEGSVVHGLRWEHQGKI